MIRFIDRMNSRSRPVIAAQLSGPEFLKVVQVLEQGREIAAALAREPGAVLTLSYDHQTTEAGSEPIFSTRGLLRY